MLKVDDNTEMGFVRIAETYPDNFILVKIVEIDHSKGIETGIVLYISTSREELVSQAKTEGIMDITIVIQGENLVPVLGGLL